LLLAKRRPGDVIRPWGGTGRLVDDDVISVEGSSRVESLEIGFGREREEGEHVKTVLMEVMADSIPA
jgi:hypothetical protein